ncbi:unnamed protein product [Meganyctiphanes norvegica]|uniref:Uncharacterized protein n=1 Tax=Meganyctiphanes norvegica TaxID=48144 RepID=A0AAV2RLV7_MEGNR
MRIVYGAFTLQKIKISQKPNVTENKAKKKITCKKKKKLFRLQLFPKSEFYQSLLEKLQIQVSHLQNYISKTKNVRNNKRHRNGAIYDPKKLKKKKKKKFATFFKKRALTAENLTFFFFFF